MIQVLFMLINHQFNKTFSNMANNLLNLIKINNNNKINKWIKWTNKITFNSNSNNNNSKIMDRFKEKELWLVVDNNNNKINNSRIKMLIILMGKTITINKINNKNLSSFNNSSKCNKNLNNNNSFKIILL